MLQCASKFLALQIWHSQVRWGEERQTRHNKINPEQSSHFLCLFRIHFGPKMPESGGSRDSAECLDWRAARAPFVAGKPSLEPLPCLDADGSAARSCPGLTSFHGQDMIWWYLINIDTQYVSICHMIHMLQSFAILWTNTTNLTNNIDIYWPFLCQVRASQLSKGVHWLWEDCRISLWSSRYGQHIQRPEVQCKQSARSNWSRQTLDFCWLWSIYLINSINMNSMVFHLIHHNNLVDKEQRGWTQSRHNIQIKIWIIARYYKIS